MLRMIEGARRHPLYRTEGAPKLGGGGIRALPNPSHCPQGVDGRRGGPTHPTNPRRMGARREAWPATPCAPMGLIWHESTSPSGPHFGA
jgi:hypothetical protein